MMSILNLLKCILVLLCLNICTVSSLKLKSVQNVRVRRQSAVPTESPGAEPQSKVVAEPGSEPEPEIKAESEPETKPEVEHEPGTEPESEPESEPEDEDGDQAFAEPTPNWTAAYIEWGWSWQFHCYFCGGLFAVLGAYSFFCIIKLSAIKLPSKSYFIALNVIVLIMAVDRATFLIVDPYGSENILPLPVIYVMLGLGFPCLTSSFSILFLALLSATKMQPLSRKIQRPQVLGSIITFHFILSITSDVLAGKFLAPEIVLYLCQSAFIIWGSFLFFSYLLIFRRLHRSAVRVSKEINHLSLIAHAMSANGNEPKKLKVRWGSAVKVTLITALLGLGLCGLQLYGMLEVYTPNTDELPQPWPWWIYQTIFRICEIGMCITMCFVATQPLRQYNPLEKSNPQFSSRFTSFRSRFYLNRASKRQQNERVINKFEKPKSGREYDGNLFETSIKKPNSDMNESDPLTIIDIGKENVNFICPKESNSKQNNCI